MRNETVTTNGNAIADTLRVEDVAHAVRDMLVLVERKGVRVKRLTIDAKRIERLPNRADENEREMHNSCRIPALVLNITASMVESHSHMLDL